MTKEDRTMAARLAQRRYGSSAGGAMVDPDPDRDETGDARRYDAWFESPWGRYAWAVESRLLSAALDGSDGRLVLDVGCGTGRSSALLRSAGAHVVGIDPDVGMLGLARARVDSAILAEGERLPFREHAFDTTVAMTVLEFVPDPAEVLAEMARVTRSPGTVVVGALNPRSAWGLWHRRELRAGPWRTARFLSGRDLVRLGRAQGTVSLDQGLHAPGWLPGLARWGPAAERLGRRLRVPGAFRVLTIERR
jgi:SAM-dependent methyltransferase